MSASSWSPRALLPSRDDYRGLRRSWRGDVVAGITVGIVALPLALAFGVSSGVGAEAGLITAIIAGLVAAVFGGSDVQVSGPTGAMVVVLAPIVVSHGVGSVVIVSVLAGVIVLAAGALRLGRTVSTIPWPVIEGFTVGIGVIIFLQQVPSAVGVSGAGHSTNAVAAAVESVMGADWPEALLPLATVAVVTVIMLLLGRVSGRLPASFIAIVVVTIGAALLGVPLATIGELPHSLPLPTFPSIDLGTLSGLIGPAFAVAALAAIESLLSARVAASMSDTGPVDADRELVGQGLASIASGFFGGMPATGAIARTAVNVRSGARTRVSAIVHSLALLAVVYLAANVVSVIPLAALSGVLMVTAARMVSPTVIGQVMRSTRSDAVVFVVTAIITVSFDLIVAVGIGVAVAAFFALRSLSTASGVHREELAGAPEPGDERIAVFRIDGSLFFGAAERILDRIGAHDGVEVVVLRLSHLQLIDATGAHTLTELVTALERRGVTVLIKGIRPEHRTLLERLGVIDSLRHPNHLFVDLEPAIAHARSHVGRTAAAAG
ncbi:SulP family sulfate permease [Labedella gwakjiensis]|uniref:SulP family inorganic anion transporter n=1 Tax=Labedella gwakjiensis TaxID=390269 RepID=A0A2P8GYR5_9MICO|nr:SulP family inorganic anion transporter [Labedella gwakjiensis]PSL39108.1 SulP family sulfate permease [Labedella gwakjiensis]RUQ86449.1 SulP family inorganic anion transporter [Labedella gwakjiensis]